MFRFSSLCKTDLHKFKQKCKTQTQLHTTFKCKSKHTNNMWGRCDGNDDEELKTKKIEFTHSFDKLKIGFLFNFPKFHFSLCHFFHLQFLFLVSHSIHFHSPNSHQMPNTHFLQTRIFIVNFSNEFLCYRSHVNSPLFLRIQVNL